jgi:hypothetical protein
MALPLAGIDLSTSSVKIAEVRKKTSKISVFFIKIYKYYRF